MKKKSMIDTALERITLVRGKGFIILKPGKSLPTELALLIILEEERKNKKSSPSPSFFEPMK